MNIIYLKINQLINEILLFFFLLFNGALGFGQVNQFNTIGTSTLTVPAGVTFATFECLGAGGGGGGTSVASAVAACGGGGGGGAYSKVTIAVTPGQVLTIFVGDGGTVGNLTDQDGTSGQTSYVSNGSTILCSALGGFGGSGAYSGNKPGGTGGNTGVGFLYSGGNGSAGGASKGGGGGGAANSTSNGVIGTFGTGGAAGTGSFLSGPGGNWSNTTWSGLQPSVYGGGGAGGGHGSTSGSNTSGGRGAQGRVVVTFCSNTITTQPSTAAQNICSIGGASTALTVAATGATSFQWYSNITSSNSLLTATAVGTGTSYTPPTASVGVKYYFCVATWAGGCTAISNVSGGVFVGSPVLSNGSSLICNNGSLVLDAGAPGATSYSWSPGTGLSGTTTASVTANPSVTTTYTVTTSGGTCGATSTSITVNPGIAFSATASADNLVGYAGTYSGQTINLNAYPIQNILSGCKFNGSFADVISGTWTIGAYTTPATTCAQLANPLLSTAINVFLGNTYTATPQEGSGLLLFNSGSNEPGDLARIISPSFSTVGYTGVILDFWYLHFVLSGGTTVKVQYSLNGAAFVDFSPVQSYSKTAYSSTCPSWLNHSFELPPALLGQANVRIQFEFNSAGNCIGYDSALDNIRISGIKTTGGYSYYNNYLWTESSTGASVNIVNPLIRSTSTADLNNENATGVITFNVNLTDNGGCVFSATDYVNLVTTGGGTAAGSASANPTIICSTPGTTNLSFTGNTPSSVQWQYSTVGAGGPWFDIAGATTINYTVTGITQTTWYKLKDVTNWGDISGSCKSSISYSPVMVTLESLSPGSVQIPGVTVCAGADPSAFGMVTLPTISGLSGYNYQWYSAPGDVSAPTGSTVPGGWTAIGAPTAGGTVPFLWSANFESGSPWITSGNFAVGPPVSGNVVTTTNSGANILGTVLNNLYAANCTEIANTAISPTINLTGVSNPVLKYYSRSRFACGTFACGFAAGPDFGKVYLSLDDGVTWGAAIETFNGNEGAYTLHTINIPSAANISQVKIKYTMFSDGSNHYTGWNIDDVSIEGTTPVSPTYNPPVTNSGTPTTTYALFITTSGACPLNTWATSEYTVTVNPCPMPIELVSFNGNCSGRDKVFTWSTASELNNQYFTLEKSKDGQNFEVANIVQGAGTTSETQFYTATVTNANDEFTYFRLKQTDNDGSSDYSNVIYVGCENSLTSSDIWLFPNPASTQITLNFSSVIDGEYALTVCDILGKEIIKENVNLSLQSAHVFDIHYLSRGNYIVKCVNIVSGEQLETVRFTKMD